MGSFRQRPSDTIEVTIVTDLLELPPGTIAPKTGKYRCRMCGPDGVAAALIEANKGNAEFNFYAVHAYPNFKNIRHFVEGDPLPFCSLCKTTEGWTFVDEHQSDPSLKHNDPIEQCSVCDVCLRSVTRPEGYLLTTTEVVSAPSYWKLYYVMHQMEFARLGYLSYEAVQSNREITCGRLVAQNSPWMVCDKCVSMFAVDQAQAREYALRWYASDGVVAPPGSGPATLAEVRFEEDRLHTEIAVAHRKSWWQFWR